MASDSVADIVVSRTLVQELPAGSRLIGDKGYLSTDEEVAYAEAVQLSFSLLRRRTMKAQYPTWLAW